MSAQTGTAPPSGPVSQRVVDRARYRLNLWEANPNPILIRELKQGVRMGRTPILLMVITIIIALMMALIGGAMSSQQSPAKVGIAIFQTFFSMSFFVVTWFGPAVAANSIASEREGRTWEALVLTGMRPKAIAHGKFLASYATICLYIIMLAPIGAIPFLFGGVTALEVIVAFAFLFLIALLSVAFGLAISSKMASMRGSIVLTLLLSVPISMALFGMFGPGLSYAAHEAWPAVEEGLPVWLPAAYDRAPFGIEYIVFLIVIPLVSIILPAWFLYEVTIANLASASDDRSSGLKRWFSVSTPIIVIASAVPALVISREPDAAAVLGCSFLLMHLTFCSFVFQGEPVGPSRRVLVRWSREGAGKVRRFMGPGIISSCVLQFALGIAGFVLVMGLGNYAIEALGAPTAKEQHQRVILFGAYCTTFYVFTTGFSAWNRARTNAPTLARVLLAAMLGAVAIVPWIVAAMVGISDKGDDQLLLAAPSPFYAIRMVAAVGDSADQPVIIWGIVAVFTWGLLGVVMFAIGRRKAAAVIAEYNAKLQEADLWFEREDAGLAPDGDDAAADAEPTDGEEPVAPGADAQTNPRAVAAEPSTDPKDGPKSP